MIPQAFQKILVLDDDKIQHIILKKKLGILMPDAMVNFTLTPNEAFEFLDANKVDLIFLDLNLPDMNGWEFTDLLKKRFVDSKIILVSGSVSAEEFEKANNDQFIHAIYEKPISDFDLREIFGV